MRARCPQAIPQVAYVMNAVGELPKGCNKTLVIIPDVLMNASKRRLPPGSSDCSGERISGCGSLSMWRVQRPTFWLRHAGPVSQEKQEGATPRCLEPMVRQFLNQSSVPFAESPLQDVPQRSCNPWTVCPSRLSTRFTPRARRAPEPIYPPGAPTGNLHIVHLQEHRRRYARRPRRLDHPPGTWVTA